MNRDGALHSVATELAAAAAARAAGNHGMVRVCARRAAGAALRWWIVRNGLRNWGSDAVTQLRRLHSEAGVSEDVRGAAARLTARVREDFTLPFDHDPIDDSRLIVTWIMAQD